MSLILDNNRLVLVKARINPQNQHRLLEALKENSTLIQIWLSGSTYTDGVVDDLCALIEHNSTLRYLSFLEEEFTDAGLSKLLRSLCTNTSIKYLDLRRCKVTDATVNDLCLLSVQNSTLQGLQFHQAVFSDTGVSQLLRSLCRNSSLKHLVFWDSHLSDEVIGDLCMWIDQANVMEHIHFSKAVFSDTGLSQLLRSLCRNTSLKQLVFTDSHLSDEVIGDLCLWIDQNNAMETLKFHEAKFSNSGLSQLLQSMCKNNTMERLEFNKSELSDAVIGDFCHFMEHNHVMEVLVFWRSKFTDAGLSTLLQALSNNSIMEKLVFGNSQLSDLVVLPMCRFLNQNSIMKKLMFSDAMFTDFGVTSVVQALTQNQTLEGLRFNSQLTDDVVSKLCQAIRNNHVMKDLRFDHDVFSDNGAAVLLQSVTLNSTLQSFLLAGIPLSDNVVSDLCTFLEDNCVMKDMTIIQTAGEAFIPALMMFLKHRVNIAIVKSIARGQTMCLMTEESDEVDTSYFHIAKVNNQVLILTRSEYLQIELMQLLREHSIPSAVDLLNNLLVLFVHKEKEAGFKQALNERLQDVHGNIAAACRIHTIDNAPQIVLENDTIDQWKSGLWVYSPETGETSTVGAILVDDEGKLYLTSTFHGKRFEKCQILNKYEGVCVAEVYTMSPLLDACLIEVLDPEAKSKHCPTLPAPHVEAALCGPYYGPNDEIARNRKPARGQRPSAATGTAVNKYGMATYLTQGKLLFYNYTHPDSQAGLDVSDALLVLPEVDDKFTEGGDSGSVIFRRSACTDTHTDSVLCHEAIAVHCGGVPLGNQKVSVACRLDDIIGHFESKLGKKLKLVGTRSNVLEEFLFRIKLGLVESDEKPLD